MNNNDTTKSLDRSQTGLRLRFRTRREKQLLKRAASRGRVSLNTFILNAALHAAKEDSNGKQS